MSQQPNEIYEFGSFRLDRQERLLVRGEATISLTPKAFDLLLALVERHGRLVEKEELFQTVWPDTIVEESNLSSNIALIRKALNDGENGLKFIETVPKRGYRFVAEVHAMPAEVEEQQLSEEAATLVAETTVPVVNTAPAVEVRLTKRSGWRERIAWVVAGAAVLVALALGLAYVRRPAPDMEMMRFSITPPEKAKLFDWPVISPDGRTLAFLAEVDGKTQLWARPLNSTLAKPLAEASNTGLPFWSPDSRFLAFFAQGELKKIALAGGTVETLGDAPNTGGGSWNRDGVILFDVSTAGIKRISANGGAVTAVTTLDRSRGEVRHEAPVFLPDGRHFLFYVQNTDPARSGGYLASLEGGEPQRLLACDSRTLGVALNPAAQDEGWLIFIRQGALLAAPFDFHRHQLAGEPVRIAGQVQVDGRVFAKFSLAANGTLALLEGAPKKRFTWRDQAGNLLGVVGQSGDWLANRPAPDGQRLVAERRDPQTLKSDIYLLELARGTETRFTFDPADDIFPIWSPDGSRIVWGSQREGATNLYQKAASGAGQDEALLRSANPKNPLDWSADGRYLLYREMNPQTNGDLWVLPLAGERKPWPWLNTPFNEYMGRFAPDGKWIAYQSNESGRVEIYVQAFVPGAAAAGGKWQLSTQGGQRPVWRRDGRELYYLAADNKLMAVDVTLGAEVKAGTPRELFSLSGLGPNTDYHAPGDGQRFLFVTSVEETSLPPFTVVLNWMAEMKK